VNPQVRVSGRGENTSVSISGGGIGTARMSMGPNGTMRLEAPKMNMAALADALSRFFDRPVVDLTELKGTYRWRWISRWRICAMREDHGMMGRAWAAAETGRGRRRMPHPIRADSRFRGGAAAWTEVGTPKSAHRPGGDRSLEKAPTENDWQLKHALPASRERLYAASAWNGVPTAGTGVHQDGRDHSTVGGVGPLPVRGVHSRVGVFGPEGRPVLEAAIPISILAIGLARLYPRRSTLLENVIITGIGGLAGSVVAGPSSRFRPSTY